MGTEAALLDFKLFDGQLGKLRRLAHAALTELYDLPCDQFRKGVAAVNKTELSKRVLVSVGQHFDLLRAQRRILQQAINRHRYDPGRSTSWDKRAASGSSHYSVGAVGGLALRSCATAVTSWAGANGFESRMLLGTPLDAHSSACAPLM